MNTRVHIVSRYKLGGEIVPLYQMKTIVSGGNFTLIYVQIVPVAS